MRRWLVPGGMILGLVAAALITIANLHGHLQRYAASLALRGSAALGRRVTFDSIGISLKGGLAVRLENVRVSDDPAYSSTDFVDARAVFVLVKPLPALLGRYEIRRILLDRPVITIVRADPGYNFESIGTARAGGSGAATTGSPTSNTIGDADRAVTRSPRVGAIIIRNGQLRVTDRASTSPDGRSIRQLDVADLSATIKIAGGAATISAARFTVGRSTVDLQAAVADLAQPIIVLTASADEFHTNDLGSGDSDDLLQDVHLDASVSPRTDNASATLKAARGRFQRVDFEQLEATLTREGAMVLLHGLDLQALDGTVRVEVQVETHHARDPEFEGELALRDVDLGRMKRSRPDKVGPRIDGRLEAHLTLNSHGRTWASIRDQLSGGGSAQIKGGRLRDFNLAEAVLTSVTGVAGLSGLLSGRTRDKYPEFFGKADTAFDELRGTVHIDGGRVSTDDLILTAPDYTIRGAGSLGSNARLNFEATLQASERLTADLATDVKEVRYLTNADGKMEIPFRLRGVLPSVRVRPDSRFVSTALARAVAGTLAEVLGNTADADEPSGTIRRQGQILKDLKRLFRPQRRAATPGSENGTVP